MTLQTWVADHNRDYQQVLARLNRTRDVLLSANDRAGAEILKKSYHFAVLSIRTERDRHERAFTALHAGELTRKEAALETVYGGHKKNWLRRTHESTDWRSLARAVRAHASAGRWETLLDAVVDNLVGVSYRKGAFMLAMAGLHEYGCVDSNVARYTGVDVASGDEFYSAGAYLDICERVFADVGGDWPPFVKQWSIYDYERGEHARHMAYFREIPVSLTR